jgi:hypothetical protein
MASHVRLALERAVRARRETPGRFDARFVMLASYPRSGNTWLRFILAHLSRLVGGHELAVDFHSVARYAPEVRYNRMIDNAVATAGWPLFLKTHFPFVGGFARYPRVLVVRDPADVMVSYHDYLCGEKHKDVGDPSRFIRHWRYGMPGWVYFHETWAGKATVVVRFEELMADAPGSVERMLEALKARGMEIGQVQREVIAAAVAAASKRKMRQALADKGDPFSGDPNYQFVRKGEAGEGRRTLDADDLAYVRALAAPVYERYGWPTPA